MFRNQQNLFPNINIIGLGLLGGSIAKACRNQNLSQTISGFDINKSEEQFAIKNNIIDKSYNFDQKINDSDLTIIAAPLFSYEEIFKKLTTKINNSLIIDIGSLKEFAIKNAQNILPNKANFIGCHPIAGSEKSGIVNSEDNLFSGKKTIITPSQLNDKIALEKIELFWKKIGCNVEFIDAKTHDKIFALVSHLPQFLSFIANENYQETSNESLNKHFRLQNSNPKMWQEIFFLNKENLKFYLGEFLKNIDDFLAKSKPTNLLNGDLINKRSALISCFLEISDLKTFKLYGGSGLRDFTAINSAPILNQETIDFLKQIKFKVCQFN